ncbi:MAG: response regulator [Deltaproteobacteria bacterium]|nr:response regulator [Deltaproteobacteria bacterium]MBN2672167.1 response regulator [Deltaproteobacteria bacterium]
MSSKTLLFADDSATMRLIMEKTFQGEDFTVVTVPSGQAAIEKAAELAPAIIIADAGMTGVSGYDVCEAIRNNGSLSATPVVIMSGISNPYDESRGKTVDATEHIKKPFDTTKLITRVKELCAEEAERPSVTGVSSGLGVAPARPNLHMPPVPRKDALSEAPSTNSTLHAFPRPGLSDAPAPAVQPIAVADPSTPKFPETQPQIEVPPAAVEPEPIELADEDNSSEIQVGTLAELAQMNEQGGHIPQEVRDDAIELEGAAHTDEIPPISRTSQAPAPASASPIAEAASRAAAAVAGGVEGLTSEQAQAIMALTEDVVEKVVWEVVPDLAEAIIREKLNELLNE